jgi:preprotein translocase subunit SecA
MFRNVFKKIFGTKQGRDLKSIIPIVKEINDLEETIKKLSDEELKAQTTKFREKLANGSTLNDILVEAFATVREASVRTLKMRHFDVQLVGGIVLHQGKIAEMKTGEGKTLTATLPLYLNALTGKGAHLVTVNDYLAKRDAEWMGEVYRWLGLSVGCILTEMDDEERKEAYQNDITYGTNNEFAFDYLRDNMKFDLDQYVQKKHNFCIVDEVDSILIDEARTPLLISGPSEGDTDLYDKVNKLIPKLEVEKHYTVDIKSHNSIFTENGIVYLQKILEVKNLYEMQHIELVHHLNQALKAHTLFTNDVDYIVRDGQVIIVDEFTGRLKEGSRWSDGLHQAVEAKENVKVKSENQTLASITFQNYFRLYQKLSGMTGTADTEAEEFRKIYELDVIVIPTNVPLQRNDMADVVYKNKKAKYKAAAKLIVELNKKNQPVLVGTISIESSEEISAYLRKKKVAHNILNAKQHEREANIVADAGQPGAVTIATNMAGRGTDIKLTDKTKDAGGLFILGTERHDSRRIDNQLRGRSGRQGDPGASKFFISLEDDLMKRFGSDRIQSIMNTLGMDEDEPIEHKMITNAIAKAQKKVESHNFDIRKHLLDFDNVMHEQRKLIYKIRRDILEDIANIELVNDFLEDVSKDFVENFRPKDKVPLEKWPWEEMSNTFKSQFFTEYEVNAQECSDKNLGNVSDYIYDINKELIKSKFSEYDPEHVKLAYKEILLSQFDSHWKDHLLAMDHMKEGINLRSYGQKDPLIEYKKEAFILFEDMRIRVKSAIISQLFSVELLTQDEIEQLRKEQEVKLKEQMDAHKRAMALEDSQNANKKPVRRSLKKVGRNDACPCGSGKKYKHCHG